MSVLSWCQSCVAGRAQPAGRAVDHAGGPRACDRADALARHPGAQVVIAVAVQIARGKRCTELVAGLGGVGHAAAALAERLGPGRRQPRGGAVEDVHGPRVGSRAGVLAGRAERQVGEPVAVEVAGRERGAEPIARLGGPAESVLVPDLVAGIGQPAGRAVEDVDRAGVGGGADVLERGTDRAVGEPVTVEVAGGRRGGGRRRPERRLVGSRGVDLDPARHRRHPGVVEQEEHVVARGRDVGRRRGDHVDALTGEVVQHLELDVALVHVDAVGGRGRRHQHRPLDSGAGARDPEGIAPVDRLPGTSRSAGAIP